MMIPPTQITLLIGMQDPRQRNGAWVVFQKLYEPVIAGWCRAHHLQPADVEDVTQTVLAKLFRKLTTHHHDPDRGRFRSWLATVVCNAVRDLRRKCASQPGACGVGGSEAVERVEGLESPKSLDELFDSLHTPLTPELSAVLERTRQRVREASWYVWEQVVSHERTAPEAGAEVGLSRAASYQAFYRVREYLKKEIERCRSGVQPVGGRNDAGHVS